MSKNDLFLCSILCFWHAYLLSKSSLSKLMSNNLPSLFPLHANFFFLANGSFWHVDNLLVELMVVKNNNLTYPRVYLTPRLLSLDDFWSSDHEVKRSFVSKYSHSIFWPYLISLLTSFGLSSFVKTTPLKVQKCFLDNYPAPTYDDTICLVTVL